MVRHGAVLWMSRVSQRFSVMTGTLEAPTQCPCKREGEIERERERKKERERERKRERQSVSSPQIDSLEVRR